jgi:hypothetical protein
LQSKHEHRRLTLDEGFTARLAATRWPTAETLLSPRKPQLSTQQIKQITLWASERQGEAKPTVPDQRVENKTTLGAAALRPLPKHYSPQVMICNTIRLRQFDRFFTAGSLPQAQDMHHAQTRSGLRTEHEGRGITLRMMTVNGHELITKDAFANHSTQNLNGRVGKVIQLRANSAHDTSYTFCLFMQMMMTVEHQDKWTNTQKHLNNRIDKTQIPSSRIWKATSTCHKSART